MLGDLRAGLRVFEKRGEVGVRKRLRVLDKPLVCHLGTFTFLALMPLAYPRLGWVYAAGVAGVGVLLVYEHLLVRPDDLTRVNRAFFHVNAVISLGLFAVASLDLWLTSG